jgi:hypothetical protein
MAGMVLFVDPRAQELAAYQREFSHPLYRQPFVQMVRLLRLKRSGSARSSDPMMTSGFDRICFLSAVVDERSLSENLGISAPFLKADRVGRSGQEEERLPG